MRTVSAKVVKGKIVTRAKLPEGAQLTVVVHDTAPVELDADDQAAVERGRAEIRAGRYVTGDALRALIRRK